jgi:hypothetical protein
MAKKKAKEAKDINFEAIREIRLKHNQLVDEMQKTSQQLEISSTVYSLTYLHLTQCLAATGSILQEDLDYCKKLSQRIIEYSEK